MKKTVVIGTLGTVLDSGKTPKRWNKWRPTVSLCQHEDLLVHRLELLYPPRFKALADLVVEDIGLVSPETKVVLHEVDATNPWDFEEVYATFHDFAHSYSFDLDKEDYLFHITTGTHVGQICIFLLAEARFFPGRLIQTAPSRKTEPTSGTYDIIDLDLSRYDRIASRFRQQAKDDVSFLKSGIETRSRAFNQLIEQIERVAIRSREPILLMGPTGAGKSQLARRIHELKSTKRQLNGAFVEVNCATLRGDAAMSALFGHRKGAFTGAQQDRDGLLRAANGGMLFLDEIGELGLDEQAMLLRAVEEKRFLPLGADEDAGSDFQLVCGTNRDLQQGVCDGQFREDLLARINLWTFHLPGLAERREDIEPNLDYELDRFAERSGDRVTFNKEARMRLLAFAKSPEARWSANFRDLSAAVTRMATLAQGGRITVADVDDEVTRLQASWNRPNDDKSSDILIEILGEERTVALDRFDRVQLADVLEVVRNSRSLSDAGRALFAESRRAKNNPNDADRLRKYLARFDIDWRRCLP